MDQKENTDSIQEGTRLNKFIAHCGVTSRRKAADLVKQGQIKVNGQIETNPSYHVQESDIISYKGKTLKTEKNLVYILMNKAKDVICSLDDERGRKTVIDIIGGKVSERIYPVGRLDYKTTGLLLLTNDGDLAKKLSHPSHKVPKIYQVTLDKALDPKHLAMIKTGITLEDGPVQVDWIQHPDKDPKIVSLEIHVGKNRIVRRIFEHFSYEVRKLDRTYYAGLTKKDLPRSWFRHLSKKEVIMLKHFV
jgi:23S rRNA pseudouridine2605 synthase